VVDELQVLNYEVTGEETAATWDRMARLQPRGYRAIRDLLPPGAPISNDPGSRIQKLLRIAGHAIGYAAAQAENARRNLLPIGRTARPSRSGSRTSARRRRPPTR
jgi:hypothetical protein